MTLGDRTQQFPNSSVWVGGCTAFPRGPGGLGRPVHELQQGMQRRRQAPSCCPCGPTSTVRAQRSWSRAEPTLLSAAILSRRPHESSGAPTVPLLHPLFKASLSSVPKSPAMLMPVQAPHFENQGSSLEVQMVVVCGPVSPASPERWLETQNQCRSHILTRPRVTCTHIGF